MAINTYATLKTALENWPGQRTDTFWTSRVPEFITLAENRIAQTLRVRGMESMVDLVVAKAVDGGTVGGTANAITLTPTTAITAYATGQTFSFEATATNTGAVTVAISGLATKAITKGDALALEADDIIDDFTYHVYYDGTQFRIVPPGGVPLPSRFVAQRRLFIDGDPVRPLEYMTPENFWSKYVSSTTGKPQAYTIEGEFVVFGPRPDSTYAGKLFYYRRFGALDGTGDPTWVFDNAVGLYLYGALIEAYALLGNAGEVAKYSAMFDDLIDRLHKADKKDRYPRGGGLRAMPEFTGP